MRTPVRDCHLWTPLGKQGLFDLRQGGFAVIYPACVCSIIFAAGPDGVLSRCRISVERI